MAAIKNLSDRSVALHLPDGKLHHVLPGDVFPEGTVVTNPLVLGDQAPEVEDAHAEHSAEAPKRGRPAKAAEPA